MGEFTLSLHAGESAIYGLDSVPFLAATYEAARRLYEAQRPFLERRLAEDGLKLLYSAPYMAQALCADRPIRQFEDLRGVKLRVYNHLTKKLALLAGATPVAIETPDIAAAMRADRIDAFTASAQQVANRKSYAYAPYFLDVAIWIPRNAVVANKAQFEALPPEVRKAMLDAAKFAEDRAWAEIVREHAERRAALAAAGATIIAPDQAFVAAYAAAVRPLVDDWGKAAGPDGEAILAQYQR